ncbi:putative peptidoglycan glycosyltransferase FtsW [Candidatus Kuenenia stuttgartiensis]|uniref:Probable peptidoglycan glycosyltransferase FtsW n=1 Tax=Kuenenia stuttgartiensis TaxID=174633 RepID=Q1Q6D0_KUEST|nr:MULTISPECIES: putative lipid II flippase FtsW [Kuenenia]MBE7548360.1 putative lipid II flippase FtsW [Planctomycetia bacterium]MBZ0192402.1 putative lipid II flippase FtsW [Candidatus Kuenenia stuttgartiensis]MCL4726315.1 putative lipid II flippase FtsW [Candidatus Kuenenia stuttgartiensis]MCZ7620981.1 putative lipid II flippase FtsW [Candidatus Kuenenia sp.]QII13071.1 putative peptidoglycan glycosyltransferase FtsW [Candidatus Kuenenia stuttgartiensis]
MKSWHCLVYIVVALLGFSIVTVYSTDTTMFAADSNGYQFAKHLLWIVLSLVVLIAMSYVDYRHLQKLTYPIIAVSVISLILVLLPGVGTVANGARRWIRLGGIAGIQPSEFAKLATIIFISNYIAKNHNHMHSFKSGFLIPLGFIAMMGGLILMEPDFGTAAFIVILSILMCMVGGTRIIFIFFTLLASAPFIYELIFSVTYRKIRFTSFLDPWQDPQGTGYHVIQSWIALGSGGLTGLGLGNSKQKLFFLPESSSDFIFTVIGEEFGFIGGMTIIVLFSLLLWQGLRIVSRTKDVFGFFLGLGITMMFGLQSIMNIAVVSGIIPTKGIPLPFLSTGGSSLLFSMLGIGILVNIAKQSLRCDADKLLNGEAKEKLSVNERFFPVRITGKIISKISAFSW